MHGGCGDTVKYLGQTTLCRTAKRKHTGSVSKNWIIFSQSALFSAQTHLNCAIVSAELCSIAKGLLKWEEQSLPGCTEKFLLEVSKGQCGRLKSSLTPYSSGTHSCQPHRWEKMKRFCCWEMSLLLYFKAWGWWNAETCFLFWETNPCSKIFIKNIIICIIFILYSLKQNMHNI